MRNRRNPPARWTLITAVEVLTLVVLLCLLGWGLDWGGRIAAQSVIARSVQRAEHLSERPSVHLRGTFLLPQVVTGRYSEVDITARGVRRKNLRLASVTARLSGVRVALHDVVTDRISTIFVEHSHETVVLTYRDLDRFIAANGSRITVSAGSSGQLKLTGHTTVLGRTVALSADARVAVVPGYLEITPTQLDTGTSVDDATRLLLGQRVTVAIPLASLPFGQHVTSTRAGATRLTVRAAGRDIVLARNSLQAGS